MQKTPEELRKLFDILVSKGVFEQKNATVSLYFDNEGILQTIHREDFLYKKGKE